ARPRHLSAAGAAARAARRRGAGRARPPPRRTRSAARGVESAQGEHAAGPVRRRARKDPDRNRPRWGPAQNKELKPQASSHKPQATVRLKPDTTDFLRLEA